MLAQIPAQRLPADFGINTTWFVHRTLFSTLGSAVLAFQVYELNVIFWFAFGRGFGIVRD
jgi:hypothetical protein